MKKLQIITVLGIVLFSLSTLSWAGDSFSFTVSCTIPAIPGLNAPPLEEEKKEPLSQNKISQENKEKETTSKEETKPMLSEEKRETFRIVKTIYPR